MKIANAFYISALLIFVLGCGNSDAARKQGEIYGQCFKDNTCNEGLMCETEHNVCVKDEKNDAGDHEMSDDDSETSDVDADVGETDDADTAGIWQDPHTGLIWSEKHYLTKTPTLDSLTAYCEDLADGGFRDWKMPTIDELRTLIQNCANTEPYGICSISEKNGSLEYKDDDEWICDCEWKDEWTQQVGKDEFIYDNGGYYSRLGDNQDVVLCSSSLNSYNSGLWCVGFDIAVIGVASPGRVNVVRCVGSYSRQKPCEGLPENAVWNVYSGIPQAWDGSSWQPSDAPSYNEKPSETECRFICNSGYKWDGSKCSLQNVKEIAGCSPESPTPCYDSSSGLIWSAKAPDEMLYYDAIDYCDNLVEGGLGDWHLPTISELRTLIQNCLWTVTGGNCNITDDCLSAEYCEYRYSQCYNDCRDLSGSHSIYSKFGDEGDFLSSSVVTDFSEAVWGVGFDKAQILIFGTDEVYDKGSARCVR